jgi:hypothetical protein
LANLNPHKDVVFLCKVSRFISRELINSSYLFVSDGKLAGGDLVVLGEGVQLLYSITLGNRCGKLDIGLGILMSRLS